MRLITLVIGVAAGAAVAVLVGARSDVMSDRLNRGDEVKDVGVAEEVTDGA